MAAQTPPFALAASSHSAELFRRAVGSLCTGTGVVGISDLKVTQNTGTDLKCQIAAGQIWIPGTLGSTTGMMPNATVQSNYSPTSGNFTSQGNYYGFNDAAITAVAFSPANVTNPRIDLVVATVQDAGYAGGTNNWVPQVVTGTAAGTPVAPAIPANTVVLAEVAIAANATAVVNANITDRRPFVRLGLLADTYRSALISTSESTTSTTATDLTTGGPTVGVAVPNSGSVMVTMTAQISCSASGVAGIMGFSASGANTIAFSNQQQLALSTTNFAQASASYLLTGLAAGVTTFVAKYLQAGGTATFSARRLTVQAIP